MLHCFKAKLKTSLKMALNKGHTRICRLKREREESSGQQHRHIPSYKDGFNYKQIQFIKKRNEYVKIMIKKYGQTWQLHEAGFELD